MTLLEWFAVFLAYLLPEALCDAHDDDEPQDEDDCLLDIHLELDGCVIIEGSD